METAIDPQLLNFVLQLALYLLVAFGLLVVGVAAVYTIMFAKGNLSGSSIASILQQTDAPKLATIILIILAATLLGLLRVIEGEAVIALLSGIAGYVLGSRPRSDGPREK